MSNDTPETIEAQPAPLSHLATAGQNPAFYRRLEWRSIAVLLLVVAALIALVVGPSLLSSDQPAQPAAAAPQPSEQDSPMAQSTPASSSQLPPFAQAHKSNWRRPLKLTAGLQMNWLRPSPPPNLEIRHSLTRNISRP